MEGRGGGGGGAGICNYLTTRFLLLIFVLHHLDLLSNSSAFFFFLLFFFFLFSFLSSFCLSFLLSFFLSLTEQQFPTPSEDAGCCDNAGVADTHRENLQMKLSAPEALHFFLPSVCLSTCHRFVDSVVKASASRAADLGSIPAFAVIFFSRSSHTSALKIDTYSNGYTAR